MFKLHLGPLEVNLDEFVKAVIDLVSTDLDNKSKKDISDLIAGVRTTYDTIVDTLDPFFMVRIQSEDKEYVIEFTHQFKAFKTMLKKNSDELRTHCTTIQNNMAKLLQNRDWLSRIPHKKKSLEALKGFADKWSRDENSLADILDTFLKEVNQELSRLDELNAENLIPESREGLRAFMKESEPSLLKIKRQLDDLNIISVKPV